MLHLPGFYYVKKPKRFVILCFDKSSERNLSCFFDMRKPRKMKHLHKEEPFSSDPYFNTFFLCVTSLNFDAEIHIFMTSYLVPGDIRKVNFFAQTERNDLTPWGTNFT